MRDVGRDRVAEIYRYLDSLPTHQAWLALRDGAPAALFQTYQPDARNDRAQARLRRTGFVDGPLVDLPEKQARLMFLDRAAAGR